MPVHVPAVWKLAVPPKIHIFLWLLANNRLLPRDNLNKRQNVPDLSSVLSSEAEACMLGK